MESLNIREMCFGTMKPFFQPTVPWCSLSPRERVGVRGKGLSTNPTFMRYAASLPRFMESLNIREMSVATMNRIAKLRRSAMSIADNASWFLLKLRRSGIFVRRFMEGRYPSKIDRRQITPPPHVGCYGGNKTGPATHVAN
jgi:hypothetical protein